MNFAKGALVGLALLALLPADAVSAETGRYNSLGGIQGMDLAYDFRLTEPKVAALFLRLIHETWQDQTVRGMKDAPRFVVVVNGGAVKLIAKDQPGYSDEDRVYIEEIAERIEQMAADGIQFEGCLKAAAIFGVDHELFVDDIHKISNAWISIAGYQAQQYAFMPIN